MYDKNVYLIEMPEHDSVSLSINPETDPLFSLGERIQAVCDGAYMNGYGWAALVQFHLERTDPDLIRRVDVSPEAGMMSVYMSHSAENVEAMKRLEAHVLALLADEDALMALVRDHCGEIDWD